MSLTTAFHLFQQIAAFFQLRIDVVRKVLNMDHARGFLALCCAEGWNREFTHSSAFFRCSRLQPKILFTHLAEWHGSRPYSAINKNIVFIFTSHHFQATTVAPRLIHPLNHFPAVVAVTVSRQVIPAAVTQPDS
nr:Uncharacterised protein [Raoultella sp. NCTC 9187]